jgi:hypothetical protein
MTPSPLRSVLMRFRDWGATLYRIYPLPASVHRLFGPCNVCEGPRTGGFQVYPYVGYGFQRKPPVSGRATCLRRDPMSKSTDLPHRLGMRVDRLEISAIRVVKEEPDCRQVYFTDLPPRILHRVELPK